MQDKTRDRLNQVSTATLTMQLLKRGLRRCYMPGVHRLDASMGRIAGPAEDLVTVYLSRTTRIRAWDGPVA